MSDTTTARDLIPAATAAFTERVHQIPGDRWSAPTPCTDWSVRDLVNHLTNEHLWAPHVLRGDALTQVGDRYDGDVLGDDPVAAWDAAAAQSLPAFAEASDDALVHLSPGDAPVSEYADQMLLDIVVHAWDLARGAGLDDRLDPATVQYVLDYTVGAIHQWEGTDYFAAPIEADSDDPQDRLIALLGRQP